MSLIDDIVATSHYLQTGSTDIGCHMRYS